MTPWTPFVFSYDDSVHRDCLLSTSSWGRVTAADHPAQPHSVPCTHQWPASVDRSLSCSELESQTSAVHASLSELRDESLCKERRWIIDGIGWVWMFKRAPFSQLPFTLLLLLCATPHLLPPQPQLPQLFVVVVDCSDFHYLCGLSLLFFFNIF